MTKTLTRLLAIAALIAALCGVSDAQFMMTSGGSTSPPSGGGGPPAVSNSCEGITSSNYYVRAGGTGSGTSWSDAADQIPTTITRGTCVWVADGTYTGVTFDDATSGTTVSVIQKATADHHGTETGWNGAYGDGQAVIGDISITTSYWIIDGAVRDEDDWFASSAYGFSIGSDTSQNQISIQNYGSAPDNVTIKYVYVPGWAAALPGTTQRIYAIDTDDFDGGSVANNLTFSRMYVSGSNNVWFLRTTNGAVVEYSASSGAKSNGPNHGEIVNLYYSGNDATIRYNKFKNAFVGSGGTAIVAVVFQTGYLRFYGNLVWDYEVTDGIIGFLTSGDLSNSLMANNTFVDASGGFFDGFQAPMGSGNVVVCNLWINPQNVAIDAGSGATVAYNATSEGSLSGSNNQTGVSTSIFTDYSGDDFTLASATTSCGGAGLGSPYNQDLLGVTRGADGTWDRGAYEYVAP